MDACGHSLRRRWSTEVTFIAPKLRTFCFAISVTWVYFSFVHVLPLDGGGQNGGVQPFQSLAPLSNLPPSRGKANLCFSVPRTLLKTVYFPTFLTHGPAILYSIATPAERNRATHRASWRRLWPA